MEKVQGRKTLDSWIVKVLFPAILLVYPLRHVVFGVEWWDTGYNYGNFLYMDRMDPMWMFSTYLGNALGNLFTRLPFGDRMVGLNFYTGLMASILALSGYYFFTKKVRLHPGFAFAGEMLALNLCWCPTALLYNYLTYVLFGAGVIALYCALTEEKKYLFVVAGIFLGVNVFVRFPNLAEIGLIVGVWAYGVICKKKFGKVFRETLWCVAGFVLGASLCLGFLAARYGLGEYAAAVQRLLSMPSEASGYTVSSMISSQWDNYLQNLIWLGYLAGFMCLGILGFAILPGRLVKLKKIGYIVCVFLSFYYMMMRHDMFTMRYVTKESVFQWAVFFLTATMFAGIVTIFRKKADSKDKLLLGLGMLILVITPLGSNNHLYSSINNLFLVAPFTLWMLFRFLKWMPSLWQPVKAGAGKFLKIYSFPVKGMILCMLFMLGIQSMGFGICYVFSETRGGENLRTKIEANEVLRGMYTSPDRAELIGTISAYVKEEGLQGKDVILYGKIPAMSYYLQMPFAITSWPDLASYHYSVMEDDLKKLSEQIAAGEREVPAVLLEAGLKDEAIKAENPENGKEAKSPGNAALEEEDPKLSLLLQWMRQYGYKITFENEKFVLLQSVKGTQKRGLQ